MTVTAFHVIPFVVVFHTERVYTIFFSKIVGLVFGPSCKVPSSAVRPSEVSLCGDII